MCNKNSSRHYFNIIVKNIETYGYVKLDNKYIN